MTEDRPTMESDPIRYVSEPLFRARGWMRFLAVLLFVGGGLYALTIIGIIIAWLPIMLGVFLWQAAAAVEEGHPSGDAELLRRANDRLRTLFISYGVLVIVSIALVAVALVFAIGFRLTDDFWRELDSLR